ncbi:hypothetical protein BURKHO8Y_180083 [Burkholderia sp. 8Y]|nr:hypothetical protein BURKHO8Y_180083 [Burkholderia sp. 8Y]
MRDHRCGIRDQHSMQFYSRCHPCASCGLKGVPLWNQDNAETPAERFIFMIGFGKRPLLRIFLFIPMRSVEWYRTRSRVLSSIVEAFTRRPCRYFDYRH